MSDLWVWVLGVLGSLTATVIIIICTRLYKKSNAQKAEKELEKENLYSDRKDAVADATKPGFDALSNQVGQLSSNGFEQEWIEQVKQAEKFIKIYKPNEALDVLLELKDRIWRFNSEDNIKQQILTNIAKAYLSMNKMTEAGRHFIEAFQYDKRGSKTTADVAFGYLLLGDNKEALKYARVALEKDPLQALATSIMVLSSDDDLEVTITKVNLALHADPDVAYAVGNKAFSFDKLLDAKEWYETSIQNGSSNHKNPLRKAQLATVNLLMSSTRYMEYKQYLQISPKVLVEKSISLFSEVIGSVPIEFAMNYHVDWILNRSYAYRVLGEDEKADEDIELAYMHRTNNFDVIKAKAFVLSNREKYTEAIALLSSKDNTANDKDALSTMASCYLSLKKYNEANKQFFQYLDKVSDPQCKMDILRYLIIFYTLAENYDDAQELVNSLLEDMIFPWKSGHLTVGTYATASNRFE